MMSSGTIFMHDAEVARKPLEIVAEGAHLEPVVDRIGDKLIRAGADGPLPQLASRPAGTILKTRFGRNDPDGCFRMKSTE